MTLPVSSLLASLLVGVASPAPSPGCGQPMLEQHPGRHHRYNVSVADPVVGEVTRSYILHQPAHYDTTNTRPTPGLEDSVNNLDIWNVVGRQEGISQGFSLFLCGERREGQLC